MLRVLLACLLVGFVVCQAPVVPKWPAQYKITGTFSLPYANIVEPLAVSYDSLKNRQTFDYYNGRDTTYFDYTKGFSYEVAIGNNTKQCFVTPATGSPMSFLPDLTDASWKYMDNTSVVNNVTCYHFRQLVTNYNKTSTYDFYYSVKDQTPVQFMLLGYDFLFGSHFDLYILDYATFGAPSDADFAVPKLCSTPHTGVNELQMRQNTIARFAGIFPCHQQDLSCHFTQFMSKHSKTYADSKEYTTRMNIFGMNKKMIEEHNAQGHSYKLGMNHFGDLSHDEFKNKILLKKNKLAASPVTKPTKMDKTVADYLPTQVDWRQLGAVTKVKDQGVCGSCWSFSTTGSIEGAIFLKTGNLIPLSEQNLVDCSWNYGNNGCDGGQQQLAMQYIIDNKGVDTEASYPYSMQDDYCQFSNKTVGASIYGFHNINFGDEIELQVAIALKGPVSVSIDASHPALSFYTSGVYYEPTCGNTPDDLDHAVLAVGYGVAADGQEYWIVKNSWSTYWGDQGYVLMARNRNNNCGIASGAVYPIA